MERTKEFDLRNRPYTIDVWCEDEHGTKLVGGDAQVDVARD